MFEVAVILRVRAARRCAGDDRRVLRLPVSVLRPRAADARPGRSQKYGDKVRVVFRQFPLSIHPRRSRPPGRAVRHEQGKFWEMHDLISGTSRSSPARTSRRRRRGSGSMPRSSASASTAASRAEVSADLRPATPPASLTPATYVNGRFLSGAVVFATIVRSSSTRRSSAPVRSRRREIISASGFFVRPRKSDLATW